MHPSIVQAHPIILDGGTTPVCLPPARGVARERVIYTASEGSVCNSQPLHFEPTARVWWHRRPLQGIWDAEWVM